MTAAKQALNDLRSLLASGTYPPQTRLPPERELAARLGVTRTTLRSALATLEAEGRIWRHVGRGTFVGARPEPEEGPGGGNGAALLSADVTNPQEVMEVRLILEPRLAALASLRATPAELALMERSIRESEQTEDIAGFERSDGELHRAIAEATRNALLLALFRAVDSVREQEIWGRLKKATLTDERKRVYIAQHKEILAAIRDRDAAAAERLMRGHLETVRDNMLGGL